MTPATAASTIACPDCGRSYTCDPGGKCWCAEVSIRLPLPRDPVARCLCPCKLEALAEQSK